MALPGEKQIKDFANATMLGFGSVIEHYQQGRKIEKQQEEIYALFCPASTDEIIGTTLQDRIKLTANKALNLCSMPGIAKIWAITSKRRSPIDGKWYAIISDKTFDTIDITEYYDAQNREDKLEVEKKTKEMLEKLNIKVQVCTDINRLDSARDEKVLAGSRKIMDTNMFRLLDEVSNRTALLLLLVGYLGGGLTVSVMSFLSAVILTAVWFLTKGG